MVNIPEIATPVPASRNLEHNERAARKEIYSNGYEMFDNVVGMSYFILCSGSKTVCLLFAHHFPLVTLLGAKRLRRRYGNIGCIPSTCQLVKKVGPKIIADDYNYALAA
jgi:hypothetical protein